MITTIRKSTKSYFDDLNFPRGFSRSGEFTVIESKILNDYGHNLKDLANGSMMPENPEEIRFSECCSGLVEPQTQIEKLWKKYIQLTSPKKYESIYGTHKPQLDFDPSESSLEL